MIWIALYILIAALVTFMFLVACIKLNIRNEFNAPARTAPVLCGIFWPIAGPIYGAYLAAEWFANNYNI